MTSLNDAPNQNNNRLGYLVGNEWIIATNAYGYHGIGVNLDPTEQVNGKLYCRKAEVINY